jgi:hypothetical protein
MPDLSGTPNKYGELKTESIEAEEQRTKQVASQWKFIARQGWVPATDPIEGRVFRANMNNMASGLRGSLVEALQKSGFQEAKKVDGQSNEKFVQVSGNDINKLQEILAVYGSPLSINPNFFEEAHSFSKDYATQVQMKGASLSEDSASAQATRNYYGELKHPTVAESKAKRVDENLALIGGQNWDLTAISSPTEGKVVRLNAENMTKEFCGAIIEALQESGFTEAKTIHSKTFKQDYIQINAANTGNLIKIMAQYGPMAEKFGSEAGKEALKAEIISPKKTSLDSSGNLRTTGFTAMTP